MAPTSSSSSPLTLTNTFPKFGRELIGMEPSWYLGSPTPYYKQSHVELRARVRAFVEKHLTPYVDEWEERCVRFGEEVDFKRITKLAAEAGILAPMFPTEMGGTPLPNGEKFDAFHDLVWIDELSRTGACGLIAVITIFTMALPPVILHAKESVKQKVVGPVLRGEKMIALCITEATAGSDVAGLATTAVKTPDGKHYLVNGQKKWITQSVGADFFSVAVRTGGKGHGGVSMLLIERNTPGITVKRMKLQGNWVAGTGFITFEDVLVPVENLLGKEGEGFKIIARNLNHERLLIAVQAIRESRLCIEDAVDFARIRKTFGQRLIDHQVIRHKIGEMIRLTEASWAMAENLAFSLQNGATDEVVAGSIALLKVMSSRTFEYCAREASQILGGASYTREGKGQRIERLYREVRSYAIAGGSEEIALNLFANQVKL
jgi:alkylation response protein AidB-like acyl-CoA dehydrogenase